jgi:hypothetical protein
MKRKMGERMRKREFEHYGDEKLESRSPLGEDLF